MSTWQSNDSVRNLIIIGSGPAGYTAAIYAARANLEPLVFEGSVTAGGALMTTTDVENFPGFPEGIMGPVLMDNLRGQAERFGAELVTDDVTEVELTGDVKVVRLADGTEHVARAVILAMGSGYRKLGIEREDELAGHAPRGSSGMPQLAMRLASSGQVNIMLGAAVNDNAPDPKARDLSRPDR